MCSVPTLCAFWYNTERTSKLEMGASYAICFESLECSNVQIILNFDWFLNEFGRTEDFNTEFHFSEK